MKSDLKSDSPGLNQYQHRIDRLLRELGISSEGIAARNLCVCREAQELVLVETDCDGREHKLTPAAARGWVAMKSAAQSEGVGLQIVSAYRSVERQADIIRRKLEQGQTPAAILRASAPPGYSEHHTGCAIDIATAGCEPLEEIFETSDAFSWLTRHAGRFDFYLSYPRDNPFGYCYEPWHWLHRPESIILPDKFNARVAEKLAREKS